MAATHIILTSTDGKPERININDIIRYRAGPDGGSLACIRGDANHEYFRETPEQIDELVGGGRERQLAEALAQIASNIHPGSGGTQGAIRRVALDALSAAREG